MLLISVSHAEPFPANNKNNNGNELKTSKSEEINEIVGTIFLNCTLNELLDQVAIKKTF